LALFRSLSQWFALCLVCLWRAGTGIEFGSGTVVRYFGWAAADAPLTFAFDIWKQTQREAAAQQRVQQKKVKYTYKFTHTHTHTEDSSDRWGKQILITVMLKINSKVLINVCWSNKP